ncbi:MAG: hypothetical protein A3D15_03075 [Alphaproteobacteria bacterium RIFCSPHIGHO2_02_FULL_40_34]|nr:MAG: hypothetical protein A3D15_03075 [Alphaproteobacteria bacterium RIFCSPHIGHO2_02_FULL_40_34]OFX11021.1 MAG: hypothetical protein A3G22_01165 [Alphaproteobacteria bacterium RIFCSPLOWO2_12_FULL_40_11]
MCLFRALRSALRTAIISKHEARSTKHEARKISDTEFCIPLLATLLFLSACVASNNNFNANTPSWYIAPKQNSFENLYGVAEGHTLEEATKHALADAAARLMVGISAESSLIREENQTSVNEEMRQKVRQNIEKIDFSNFRVSRSDKIAEKFFVEVSIERTPFINDQKERVMVLEKKIADLNENSATKNPIQKRNDLIKILSLGKELELRSRILAGTGENINLTEKLNRIAEFENQFNKSSDKIEFYFEINSPQEIAKIIRNALNREKLKISSSRNSSDRNQIVIKIKSQSHTNKIYEAFLTKLEIDFENISGEKILASNSVEITGSSTISEKESYHSALKSFEEKIEKEGILKVVGITN